MAWIVRHGHWLFAAAMVAMIAAAVFSAVSFTAASFAVAVLTVALFGALFVAGLVTERAGRDLWPAEEVADDYYGAVVAGAPLSRAALRDTRRDLALSTRRAEARAKVSSIARHYRRHGGA